MNGWAAVVRWVADAGDPFGPVNQDPDAMRTAACRILAPDVVCSAPDPTPVQPPSASGGSALGSLLTVVFWLAVAALVVAAVFALVRWAPTSRRRARRPRRARRRADATVDVDQDELVETAIDHTRDPGSWRREADEHRLAGRFRDALHCRYRALVGDLARRGVIDEIPGRTTGEERSQLTEVLPAASPSFRQAADLFDDAWYGGAAVADGDLERMLTLERDVLALTDQRGGGG